MTCRDFGPSTGYIDNPALSYDIGEVYCIDCISFLQVMGGGINMGARMGAHVQVGNTVVLIFLLPEYRGHIPGISEGTFRERSRDIDKFHRLSTPPALTDEGNKSDSPVVFFSN
jgi:hypothetical protein